MNGVVRRAAIKPCLGAKGRLDQLEDRLSGTQEAGGSNPPASTSSPIQKHDSAIERMLYFSVIFNGYSRKLI